MGHISILTVYRIYLETMVEVAIASQQHIFFQLEVLFLSLLESGQAKLAANTRAGGRRRGPLKRPSGQNFALRFV